jgi:Amt family ammonium transporter
VPSAFCIGLAAGIVCYTAVTKIKSVFGYDDSLDVFGVHGVGSATGMLMLGFLARADVNPAIATTFKANGVSVSLAGSSHQFFNQLIGVAFTVMLAAVGTFVIVKIISATIGLRVTQEEESMGLDLTQHGERAYNE